MPSQAAHAVAPGLPGPGGSDVLAPASFPAFGPAILELLDRLSIAPRFVHLHDFGAPVGLQVAMQAPDKVLGLIVRNADAHRAGSGPQRAATREFWSSHPSRELGGPTGGGPAGPDGQRSHVRDHGDYAARFDPVATHLARRRPSAPMLRGRHDAFSDRRETASWMQAPPRMEARVLDAGRFLLETHAVAAASLMLGFVGRAATPSAAPRLNGSEGR